MNNKMKDILGACMAAIMILWALWLISYIAIKLVN